MKRPLRFGAQSVGEFVENVFRALVVDRVDSIETQSVEMKRLDPILSGADDEFTDRSRVLAVEVDRVTPRRLVPLGKKGRRVDRQIVSDRAEMIVDDVE